MDTRKPLMAFSVFGQSLKNAIIIAGHPDERFKPDGTYAPDARTLLLRLDGNKAVYMEEFALPLLRSWMSKNGTVYCTGAYTDKIFIRRNGLWSSETFSKTTVRVVNGLFGISAEDPSEDQLYMTTSDSIFFTRISGNWNSHVPPEEVTLLCSPYGTKPNEIYIGGSSLFLWNGTQLIQLEQPETDSMSALYVTADDRLIGGKEQLHISNEEGGWDDIKTSYSRFTKIVEFQGSLYAATFRRGIIRIYPKKPKAVTEVLKTRKIVAMNDGIIAFGDSGVFVSHDGTKWFQVEMPVCKQGERFQ